MPPFGDLHDFVAIPRLTELRLSPDGSWLAAVVQTMDADGKKFVSSIWRIDVSPAGRGRPPARLTRSAEGEGGPAFRPDGSLLFVSKRPGPAAAGPGVSAESARDKAALWLLPDGGGEREITREISDDLARRSSRDVAKRQGLIAGDTVGRIHQYSPGPIAD